MQSDAACLAVSTSPPTNSNGSDKGFVRIVFDPGPGGGTWYRRSSYKPKRHAGKTKRTTAIALILLASVSLGRPHPPVGTGTGVG